MTLERLSMVLVSMKILTMVSADQTSRTARLQRKLK